EGGDMTVRRASEGGGREYHDEIDAEALPLDRAQIGDRRGEVAAEDVNGDRIAELEAEPIRDALLERDQRRTLVVRLPPPSFNRARARRDLVSIGYAAIALKCPGGVGGRLQVLGRDAVRRQDASAQHRHALERGARDPRVDESVERFGVGGRDVDEI